MVDVPVDDGHALESRAGLGVAGGNRDIVEEAEPHRRVRPGMVSRRSDERERAALDGRPIEIPAARSDASYVVPDAIVSPSSQVGSVKDSDAADVRGEVAACDLLSVAGPPSLNSPTESSSTSIRPRRLSGW